MKRKAVAVRQKKEALSPQAQRLEWNNSRMGSNESV